MSNEYISRESVLADIEQTIENSGCVNHEGEIIDCVRYADASDVVQVVHGKWEYKPVFNFDGQGFPRYFCSACENYETQTRRFCPNCGAKMDLTKENHDI